MALSDTFRQEVRESILHLLASDALSTRELEARSGYSYTTIRRELVDLVADGQVVRFDKRARNTRYVLGTKNNSTITIIPSISFKGQTIKLTDLYLNQGLEHIGQQAVSSILQAWTTMATTARRLEEGIPSSALLGKLNRQKVNLTAARMNLEHLVFVINQLLDNHKLWEAEHLINFPTDPDWPDFLAHLEELYESFYGASKD